MNISNKKLKERSSHGSKKRKSNAHLDMPDNECLETLPTKRVRSEALHPSSQAGMETIHVIPETASGYSALNTSPDNGQSGRSGLPAAVKSAFTVVDTRNSTAAIHTPHASELPEELLPKTVEMVSEEKAGLCLLQGSITKQLIAFLCPLPDVQPDETALFNCIRRYWVLGKPDLCTKLGTHFELVSQTLDTWIESQEAVAMLRHPVRVSPDSSQELAKYLKAANTIRTLKLEKRRLVDGPSTEDLLCKAFTAMTDIEGSERLFREGLDRLELGMCRYLECVEWKIVIRTPDTKQHPAGPSQGVVVGTRSSRIANGESREKTSIEVPKSRLVILKVDPTRLHHLLTQGGHEGTETVSCHRLDHLHGVVAPMLDQRPMFLEDIEKKLSGQENITAGELQQVVSKTCFLHSPKGYVHNAHAS
jgi:hypothetical protein